MTVYLKVPDKVWVALCMVAKEFGGTPSEVAAYYIELQLEAETDTKFARTYEDLTLSVRAALKGVGEGAAELKV